MSDRRAQRKHDLTDMKDFAVACAAHPADPSYDHQELCGIAGQQFHTSKGKIYPLINRLEQAGPDLQAAHRDRSSGPRSCAALRSVSGGQGRILKIRSEHLLWTTRFVRNCAILDLLTRRSERSGFSTPRELHPQAGRVEDYGRSVEVPFKEFVHDNAVVRSAQGSTGSTHVHLPEEVRSRLRRAHSI